MVDVTLTPDEISARADQDVDYRVLRAATEADIRRHAQEDREDPDDVLAGGRSIVPAAVARARTGLTQHEFARVVGIPVDVLRDWERGQTSPDPAANSLFVLINADPERMLSLLHAAE